MTIAVAALIAVVSLGVLTKLTNDATRHRDAQVKLAVTQTELHTLQGLPFRADATHGRSLAHADESIEVSKRRITTLLDDLRRSFPTPQLAAVDVPLDANYEVLERIRVLVAQRRLDRVPPLASIAQRRADEAGRALEVASSDYERRATSSLRRATFGSGAVIVLLFIGFAFFCARSARARGENARLLAGSRREARTDALTGLRNRRALMGDLALALHRRSPGQRLVVALFDLDGFKQYNDTFGHLAGDDLLARLGGRLAATVEGLGRSYRLGGDEFCVLATIGAGGAEALLGLATAALTDVGDGFRVECSHGAAILPDDAGSAEEALGMADQRMYAQKAKVTATVVAAAAC
ncbi:MAG TPA: GGDEF domain-containing protein [Thermoleophilaceae bacterium]